MSVDLRCNNYSSRAILAQNTCYAPINDKAWTAEDRTLAGIQSRAKREHKDLVVVEDASGKQIRLMADHLAFRQGFPKVNQPVTILSLHENDLATDRTQQVKGTVIVAERRSIPLTLVGAKLAQHPFASSTIGGALAGGLGGAALGALHGGGRAGMVAGAAIGALGGMLTGAASRGAICVVSVGAHDERNYTMGLLGATAVGAALGAATGLKHGKAGILGGAISGALTGAVVGTGLLGVGALWGRLHETR